MLKKKTRNLSRKYARKLAIPYTGTCEKWRTKWAESINSKELSNKFLSKVAKK